MSPVASPSHADDAVDGVPDVEAALTGVSALGGQPVAEHLAVLDGAHSALRRVLDTPPDRAGHRPAAVPGPADPDHTST